MSKYISLGTMSGTSMDGIDLSIINSDGESDTSIIDNFFYQYSLEFKKELINIRKEVLQKDDLISKKALINDLSRKITLLHIEAIQKFLEKKFIN
jgi:anhydro-N-acetylmuramic acid kinase